MAFITFDFEDKHISFILSNKAAIALLKAIKTQYKEAENTCISIDKFISEMK